MKKFGSWERDSWSFWHQKYQLGTAGKAHCLDVSAKRICSETAHIGITWPSCFKITADWNKASSRWKNARSALGYGTNPHISYFQEGQEVNGNSQHRFITGKSYLTSLTAFCNEMTGSGDKGRAVGVIFLDFSKATITVAHAGQGWHSEEPPQTHKTC